MQREVRAAFQSVALLYCTYVCTQMAKAQDTGAKIKAVLDKQAEDWNRGDLNSFASGYKNSPEILFMGTTVKHGYAEMLATYKEHYASREAMGTLTFSHLVVHPLDERIATTTGNFQLVRSARGGGNTSGYFLLVLEKTPEGWKIICDDTTRLPAKAQLGTHR